MNDKWRDVINNMEVFNGMADQAVENMQGKSLKEIEDMALGMEPQVAKLVLIKLIRAAE